MNIGVSQFLQSQCVDQLVKAPKEYIYGPRGNNGWTPQKLLGTCLLWFASVFVWLCLQCVVYFTFVCSCCCACFEFALCLAPVFARWVSCVCVFVLARSQSVRFPQILHGVQQWVLLLCLLVSLPRIESSVLWLWFFVCSPLFPRLGNHQQAPLNPQPDFFSGSQVPNK